MATIPECHGVDAGIGIRKRRQRHCAPGSALISRPDLKNPPLLCPAQSLQPAARVRKNCWLNGTQHLWLIQRAGFLPCHARVAGTLEMDLPTSVLGAARTKDITAGQLHRLVFDWT